MNPTLQYWFRKLFMPFSPKNDMGTKFIIYDAKKSGDRTMFCHPFNVVKKTHLSNSFTWKAKCKKPKQSEKMTLAQLQKALGPERFSRFVLCLIDERIEKSKRNENNYWEKEENPITDPKLLEIHILERLAAHEKDLPMAA